MMAVNFRQHAAVRAPMAGPKAMPEWRATMTAG